MLDGSSGRGVTLSYPYRSETEALSEPDDRQVSVNLFIEALVVARRELEE
jgi:hypothetical protein